MLTVAVSFTNFGPYHLARLRALAAHLERSTARLIAYETAGTQEIYPWATPREREPFEWVTLFPSGVLEDLPASACAKAMRRALHLDRPDAVAAVGYARPESMAMARWANAHGRPAVLMSESQAVDRPRVWWKEAVKRRRVRRFASALVGGPRHAAYLESLGMPRDRIAFGYNAVDGAAFAADAGRFRDDPSARAGLPTAPYFLAVSRFAPEKNLARLVRAFARYRREAEARFEAPWDLVLCGDGPSAPEVARAADESGCAGSIHLPGFLQADELSRWYAFASAFVLPSLSEPWGLVVNEAAACGLPLLVSDRAGCAETFVPAGTATTGLRFDPKQPDAIADALTWMARLPEPERQVLGRRAAGIAAAWGPDRFARGTAEALQIALVFERLKVRASEAGTPR